MSYAGIRNLRLRNQHLTGPPARAPEDLVQKLCAVQSQDFPGAKWALGQRLKNVTDADIERAYDHGVLLRTHVLRPTWHFVLPTDIRWLLELTAPRIRALMLYYDRQLEIDRVLRNKSARVLAKRLRDGQYLTRPEISRAYAEAGIEARGQRLGHILMHAELDALICSGPLQGKQFTYALLDERAPNAPVLNREEALANLTLRFFAGHGPATPHDLAWWSGLTVADANRGIAAAGRRLESDDCEGRTYWFVSGERAVKLKSPHLRLLPNYDEYLVGYRANTAALDPALQAGIRTGELDRHFVVLNGQVVGGWRGNMSPRDVAVVSIHSGSSRQMRSR